VAHFLESIKNPGGSLRLVFTPGTPQRDKFLIGRDGEVIRRYEPNVTPEEIQPDIEALLG